MLTVRFLPCARCYVMGNSEVRHVLVHVHVGYGLLKFIFLNFLGTFARAAVEFIFRLKTFMVWSLLMKLCLYFSSHHSFLAVVLLSDAISKLRDQKLAFLVLIYYLHSFSSWLFETSIFFFILTFFAVKISRLEPRILDFSGSRVNLQVCSKIRTNLIFSN